MRLMRGWIPVLPLACGVISFGLSWIVLFAIAGDGAFGSLHAFAWVHLVALAWITTIALAILLHAVPGFLDVEWSGLGANLARASTPVFALAALALACGFFCASLPLIEIAGTIAVVALIVYVVAIIKPLLIVMKRPGNIRAIARAFTITFTMLIATVLLGLSFAYALGGNAPPRLLLGLPGAHALLGLGGWLTLLVFGISARTLGPIAGSRSRYLALHIGSSSSVLVGTLLAAIGAAMGMGGLLIAGAALLLLGALAYAADITDVLRRATVSHRPPQLLMLFAAGWAVVAAALFMASVLGASLPAAAVYAALIGWIGSAVVAHLHHIGVRVVLTQTRGEDDETRPEAVLTAPLTWTTLALYEFAAIIGTVALAGDIATLLRIAAICGFAAFGTMLVNLARAARTQPLSIISLLR